MRVANSGRGRARVYACLLSYLGTSACLIADNPRFVDSSDAADAAAEEDSGSSEGGDSAATEAEGGEQDSSEGCPPGMLDCDNDGMCEADASDLSSCGECGHVCAYPDEAELECDEGVCVAFVDIAAVEDVTLVEGEESEPPGRVRIYANGPQPRRDALLRFPSTPFEDEFELVGAELLLFSHNTTPPIGAHMITEPWEDQSATWPGPSFEMAPTLMFVPSGGPTQVPFDEALDWWEGVENFGLRLLNMDDNEAEFDSSEGAEPPRLRVELHF